MAAAQAHISVKRSDRGTACEAARSAVPQVEEAQRVAPQDARRLSKLFFERLSVLEEGTPDYQYARNTLIEMNLSLVRYVARRFRSRGQEME
ncbi:RNA polymerase sigma factor SigF, partial [Streptomyces sp. NPDC048516]